MPNVLILYSLLLFTPLGHDLGLQQHEQEAKQTSLLWTLPVRSSGAACKLVRTKARYWVQWEGCWSTRGTRHSFFHTLRAAAASRGAMGNTKPW